MPEDWIARLGASPSVASAPERHDRAAPPPPGTPAPRSRWHPRALLPSHDAILTGALAGALIALVFTTTGGTDLGPNTWSEIVLVVIAAGLAITVAVVGRSGPAWGSGALAAFAALAALTAISIAWSVQPANSWLSANQTFSYLAAFGAALALARLAPRRWGAVLGAVALACTVVSAYALLAKVFPTTIDPAANAAARLSAPFTLWNATGLMAALGLPACLWAGAALDRGRLARALSVPAIGLLISVVVLSYSRGAAIAAVIGLAVWFVFVPLRLRGALILGLGAAGAAAISAWALATHALSGDLPHRISGGHHFGIVLLVTLVALLLAGIAASLAGERVSLAAPVRRRIAIGLLILVALAPVAALGAVAVSSRGLSGEVSHLWHKLTSTDSSVSDNDPGRLVDVASTRARYWSEAFEVGEHAPFKGVGADGFGTARTRYSNDTLQVQQAHGYVLQTFADFGLLGLAVNLGLLVAWALAVRRTLRTRGRLSDGEWAERCGLLTLLSIVIVFGVHSTVDLTWFVPGTAIPALICAGWLAGRGPLQSGAAPPVAGGRLLSSPGRIAVVLAAVAVTVIAAWAIWQPLRSADADAAALSARDAGVAIGDERTSIAADPLAIDPIIDLSAIYQALGQSGLARAELLKAVQVQPQNGATWLALGEFDLARHRPALALNELIKALSLDRGSLETSGEVVQAQTEIAQQARPAPSAKRTR